MYLKRELAKVIYYDMFEKGRVVIKQGEYSTVNKHIKELRISRSIFMAHLEYLLREYCMFLIHFCVSCSPGHGGISFYFIVSGSVIVERMEEDKNTGEQHKQVYKANGMMISKKFKHS